MDRGVTLADRLRTPKALKRRCGRYLKEARPPGSSLPGKPGQVNPFGVNVTANVRGTTKCAGDSVDLGYSIAKKVGLYTVFYTCLWFHAITSVWGG